MNAAPMRLLVVSGMSGAGKSTALKILEDLGYEAVDNLPLSLLRRLTIAGGEDAGGRAIAVGIDSRTRDFRPETFRSKIDALRGRPDLQIQVLFLDCDDEVLQSRFTATRRRHPLATDRPVMDGVLAERRLLAPVRNRSDAVIDTSRLNLPDIRQLLAAQFSLDGSSGLNVAVASFSYRRGLPREADLVFDVRFLANPHYQEHLRALTGEAAAVADYVAADPAFGGFFAHVSGLVLSLLPHYEREGKRYLTVGIGCTGGRHRSVYVARRLAEAISGAGWRVALRHRDMDLDAA